LWDLRRNWTGERTGEGKRGREEGRKGGRAEGRKGGRAEGRKGGREKGRKGGREEGRKGGREKGRKGEREKGRAEPYCSETEKPAHTGVGFYCRGKEEPLAPEGRDLS
jgi:hypothetical protein